MEKLKLFLREYDDFIVMNPDVVAISAKIRDFILILTIIHQVYSYPELSRNLAPLRFMYQLQ